jgi:hypothetical protein
MPEKKARMPLQWILEENCQIEMFSSKFRGKLQETLRSVVDSLFVEITTRSQ